MDTEITRTIAQVVREYRDSLSNLIYRAWATIEQSGYEPKDVLKSGIQAQVRNDHKALIRASAPEVYIEGLREGDLTGDDLDEEDRATIKAWIDSQLPYVNEFSKAVVDAAGDKDKKRAILDRINYWVNALETLGLLGLASANKNMKVRWVLNGHHVTEEHCKTCPHLDSLAPHRLSWYTKRGYIPRQPGSATLECGGWECGCALVNVRTGEIIM